MSLLFSASAATRALRPIAPVDNRHISAYTSFREESKLGTIEPGKLGDLVVLNADYFDPAKVPDEAIKKLRSVFTVVDGKVVHSEIQ